MSNFYKVLQSFTKTSNMVCAIMVRKSKVELSPHFNEIIDMIKEGLSSRDISDYLKNEYNETITHATINNYTKKIRSKTNQEYYKKNKKKEQKIINNEIAKKEAFDEVVNKGVDDLSALDKIIQEANNLELNIGNLKTVYQENYVVNPESEIEKLKIQAKRLAIQAVNTKSKILKDSGSDDNTFEINIVGFDDEKDNSQTD